VLSLSKGAEILPPVPVFDPDTDRLAAITSDGHLLVFPLSELPRMPKGKGNKIINIPSARLKAREELAAFMVVIPEGASLTITAGKRSFTLKPSDLDNFQGERGRRGNKLPRGFQRVNAAEAG
jgi:topoisomerase-4 subunit A